ncbi:hypothetical protein BAGQ_4010 [Bacillus velezensis]|nr:hypothetical protein BAGQ_4010 [Bacillus velezensis]
MIHNFDRLSFKRSTNKMFFKYFASFLQSIPFSKMNRA